MEYDPTLNNIRNVISLAYVRAPELSNYTFHKDVVASKAYGIYRSIEHVMLRKIEEQIGNGDLG